MKPESLYHLHQNAHLSDAQTVINFHLNANGEHEAPPTAQTEADLDYYPDPTW
jgi:hypothetical protein